MIIFHAFIVFAIALSHYFASSSDYYFFDILHRRDYFPPFRHFFFFAERRAADALRFSRRREPAIFSMPDFTTSDERRR